MSEPSANEVVRRVRSKSLDCRTGLFLLPKHLLGCEKSLSVRFDLDAVDYTDWCERYLREGEKYLRFDGDKLLEYLHEACYGDFMMDCLLVYNFDLALAYLPYLERERVWVFLRDHFRKRPRGLILSMPEGASRLLPDPAALEVWTKGNRLARVK